MKKVLWLNKLGKHWVEQGFFFLIVELSRAFNMGGMSSRETEQEDACVCVCTRSI